jgi:glycosyltransferase involved in cell wall biosynthesis
MPVYNAARFLRGALDSLLSQDYPNFEIFISDNASEDDTEVICKAYAQADPRITYDRLTRNHGAFWNFMRVYEWAGGEYFMWAAHDDIRDPRYLSRAVAALENNPRAFFCSTGIRFIDPEGCDITDTFPARMFRPVGATPLERLRAVAQSTYWVDFYSLFRTTNLAKVIPIPEVWGYDVLFTAALCLRGEVVEVPDQLLFYRIFFDKSAEAVAQSLNVTVSWLHLTLEMLRCIRHAPLAFADKINIAWMFVTEFCVRNDTVNGYLHNEGFSGVRDAVAKKHIGRALAMTALALLLLTSAYFRDAWMSMRDRLTKE